MSLTSKVFGGVVQGSMAASSGNGGGMSSVIGILTNIDQHLSALIDRIRESRGGMEVPGSALSGGARGFLGSITVQIAKLADTVNVPVAAYSVSGEYAMVKAGAKLGCVDEEKIVCEMAASAYRAGVNIYLTYYAKELARFIDEGRIG